MTSAAPSDQGLSGERSLPGAFSLSRRRLGVALAGAASMFALGRSRAKTSGTATRTGGPHANFLVYYGSDFSELDPRYSLMVLEDFEATPLVRVRHRSATVLSYLSLLEIHSTRAYFRYLRDRGLLGRPNPNWPDAYFVDTRDNRFQSFVLKDLIPRTKTRGYDGLFLDTIDSAEFLETSDRASYAGIMEATAALVREIRRENPNLLVMVNRGYGILPEIAGSFDYLLGESVHTTFTAGGTYQRQSAADIDWQISHMRAAKQRDPDLQLFSLDYWDPKDPATVGAIYAEARQHGLTPYVATPDLTTIVPEP